MAKIPNRRCAKDGCEEFLTKMQCVRIANLQRYIGIRLKNALHLGKKFLAAIFSAIVYCGVINPSKLKMIYTIVASTYYKDTDVHSVLNRRLR